MEKQNKKIMNIEANPKNVSIEGLGTNEDNEYKILEFHFRIEMYLEKDDFNIFLNYSVLWILIRYESKGNLQAKYFQPTKQAFKGLSTLPLPFNLEQNEYSINLQDQTITLIER